MCASKRGACEVSRRRQVRSPLYSTRFSLAERGYRLKKKEEKANVRTVDRGRETGSKHNFT